MGKNTKVTTGDINREVGVSNLGQTNLRGGRNFPIRYGKVTRVDPKRMVVDVVLISQPNVTSKNVPITFPGAGARHFFGAMPEVGDMCLMGQQPAESGRSKRPVILGWYVPSTQAGYDWLSVRSHGPDELSLTPKQRKALEGIAVERRHKLRQMEAGNIIASSSQGSDLLLTESATLANRRGNEIILRDQDQALVVRSLQQFHAGAGFRTYSGMVQRDANLLPTEIVKDSMDWTSDRQVNESREPLNPDELDEVENAGALSLNPVYDDLITDSMTSPTDILRRGLFIDASGNLLVDPAGDGATIYGGKKMVRVAADLSGDAASDPGQETFSEYRIEVAHTSTGVLPVTEQTDGIDIDRLLISPPTTDPSATGGNQAGTSDPNLLSPNSPMVEFVLGTAVGNDYTFKPDEYGLPLVAKVTTESGEQQTVIRAYDPESDTLQDQLAFLLRSRDPEDPSKESFVALSKGGAWLSSFQGQGSKVAQENLRTGKVSFYGTDSDGQSRILNATGTVEIHTLSGRPSDNVGVNIRSDTGAVSVFGGGAVSEGAADGSQNPNSPSNSKMALKLESANGAKLQAAEQVKVAAPIIELTENKTTNVSASSAFNVNAGDAISMSSKSLGVTINGAAEYVFGGPLNALPTNGPSRSTSFSGNPATGAIGQTMDSYSMTFGKRDENIRVGRNELIVNAGGIVFECMTPPVDMIANVPVGPGFGVNLIAGPPFFSNSIEAFAGVGSFVKASSPSATAALLSLKGPTVVQGSASVAITSPFNVSVTGASMFITTALSTFSSGGVLTDGCLDSVTGRKMLLSGTAGVGSFRVL